MKSAMLTLTAVLVLGCQSFAATNGHAIYKKKCAGCHGPNGEGKVGPALKGTSLSADDIVTFLTKGDSAKKAPHKKPISGLSAAHAKEVADYVTSLK